MDEPIVVARQPSPYKGRDSGDRSGWRKGAGLIDNGARARPAPRARGTWEPSRTLGGSRGGPRDEVAVGNPGDVVTVEALRSTWRVLAPW
ncbi:hypothetical protein chiPu_0022666 [Chiloscyllium punctatum]|uniref:Uncharacterized protein n=1 Tax=Chiloscyllium punctatum TaxID=137246 RepID=A0A401RJQ1_CHIPU|nr:hypothetical protein [Chiloscyllium punctatum]